MGSPQPPRLFVNVASWLVKWGRVVSHTYWYLRSSTSAAGSRAQELLPVSCPSAGRPWGPYPQQQQQWEFLSAWASPSLPREPESARSAYCACPTQPQFRPFRDVTQSAPAPRVRTSRPEVWPPEAQPFPAREALAPPVSVGTERGGVEESRRVRLVVRCGAASPPCVLWSPVSHLTRSADAEHAAPEHRLICFRRSSLSSPEETPQD